MERRLEPAQLDLKIAGGEGLCRWPHAWINYQGPSLRFLPETGNAQRGIAPNTSAATGKSKRHLLPRARRAYMTYERTMLHGNRTPLLLRSQLNTLSQLPAPGATAAAAATAAVSIPLRRTKQIHAHLIKTQFLHAVSLPTTASAPSPHVLISSYIKNEAPADALHLYAHMRRSGHTVDAFAVPSLLKACALLSDAWRGMELHGYAVKSGLDSDVFVRNSLMQMYSECELLDSALLTFDEMPERDVVSWSTMIRCLSRCKRFNEALKLVGEMLQLGILPSEVAIVNMLTLFADIGDIKKGRPVHAYLVKNSMHPWPSLNASTALIDMYVKCGSVTTARRVFDMMKERSTASWASMIAGCIRGKDLEAAMELLVKMKDANVLPNEITMLSMVIEFALAGALEMGKWLHGYILRHGFRISVVLGTALVDLYCKCRDTRSARTMFDTMSEKDVMTWTAMISGYAHSGCINEAFDLLGKMKDANVKPNELTMVNLLNLCSEAGALDRGRWIHTLIDKQAVKLDVVLATALVDMYAKCGDVNGAYAVFTRTTDRDVCMWNAMLNGLAMNGKGYEAIELFAQMEREGIKPNDITFIGILRACSHSGLVADGKQFFDRMGRDYGLIPKVEHYGCLVDLLGRAGKLDEAHEIICRMPIAPNTVIWGALLAACKVHKNRKLGELVAKELLKLDPHSTGYNIILSNIYAIDHRWNEVAEVRRGIKDTGMQKIPGVSSIEVNGVVHDFFMGDASHPMIQKIQEMVLEMQNELKRAGHVVDTSNVFLNIDEEEKETMLNYHSEKLAMAFGLISTAANTPIRIVKNLRVCDDCHAATKLLSQIYGRVIIVRDRNRFHRFDKGSCSCNDYW